VFGWVLERAGLGWIHPHGCLDTIEVGWIGSAKEYSSNMRVRPIPRKTTDGVNLLSEPTFRDVQ